MSDSGRSRVVSLLNNERILILRARLLQDRAAFSSLVAMHQGKVRAFLMRMTRDYDQTNDLAQDTFINAFAKIDQFKAKGKFSSWLFQIAFNQYLQSRRGNERRTEVHESYGAELQLEDSIYDSISPEQLDLEVAMAQLKSEQAAAITLCYSYGCSHSEAAEILAIPVGSVKTNIRRGKEKLLKILQDKRLRPASNE